MGVTILYLNRAMVNRANPTYPRKGIKTINHNFEKPARGCPAVAEGLLAKLLKVFSPSPFDEAALFGKQAGGKFGRLGPQVETVGHGAIDKVGPP